MDQPTTRAAETDAEIITALVSFVMKHPKQTREAMIQMLEVIAQMKEAEERRLKECRS